MISRTLIALLAISLTASCSWLGIDDEQKPVTHQKTAVPVKVENKTKSDGDGFFSFSWLGLGDDETKPIQQKPITQQKPTALPIAPTVRATDGKTESEDDGFFSFSGLGLGDDEQKSATQKKATGQLTQQKAVAPLPGITVVPAPVAAATKISDNKTESDEGGFFSFSWLGLGEDKKPEPQKKASAPIVKTANQKMDGDQIKQAVEDFFALLPIEIKNTYWPSNGHIPAENLAFRDKFNAESFTAGKEPKQGLKITARPLIAEDRIFTLGGDGLLQVRKLDDLSQVLWEAQITEKPIQKKRDIIQKTTDLATSVFTEKTAFIGGNFCYSLGHLYVVTKRGNVFAFRASDGQPLWSRNFGVTIRSSPIARADKLIFVTTDNKTMAISTEDGGLLWQHQGMVETSKILSSPAPLIVNNKVVVTYSSGEIFELNLETGVEQWDAEAVTSAYGTGTALMSDISYNPVYHNGVIYIVTSDGTLTALDANGKPLWAFEGEVINRSVWPVGDFLFTTTRFGDILAISAWNGQLVWKNRMAGSKDIHEKELQFSGLVMAHGRLYAADNHGTLYAYSSKDGGTLSRTSIPEGVQLTPIVAEGMMFLMTKDSKLVVVK